MQEERGFIGTAILILLALVALKYFFGFSVFDWAASSRGKEALQYLWQILASLKGAFLALWSYIH